MKPLVIVGGGGHAKVLIEAIRSAGEFVIKGIVDEKLPVHQTVLEIPVLGDDSWLSSAEAAGCYLAMGVGLARVGEIRKRLYFRCIGIGFSFPVIKHREAIVCGGLVGEGTQILTRAIVHPDVSVGPNCIINTGAIVEHDCRIGGHSHVGPGSVLGGNVIIGESSLIGLGAIVLPGVKIGHRVSVGAGAVVVNDIADDTTVVGVPARPIVKPAAIVS
ncbi:MAG: NeuD/PglB/VioB family sugar acetyltransferase [Patescibacteria group bacterium]